MRSFATWWFAASLVILSVSIRTLLGIFGVTDVAVYVAIGHLSNLALASALGALMFYILYLLLGLRALLAPITVLYTLYFTYLVWNTMRQGNRTLEVHDWGVRLVGESEVTAAADVLFGLLLAAPVLIFVIAYMVLALRVPSRTQRYRLVLVSGAFLFLFGTILLGFLLGWSREPWFPLAYQIPALLASLIVVAAYRPPEIVQRFGVRPI